MPPPIDLTGRKIGRLTVLQLVEKGAVGKANRWLCRCDCGAETTVFQRRLPYTAKTKDPIDCCEACRARSCEICGAPISASCQNRKTCGPECHAERERRYQLAYYREKYRDNPTSIAAHRDRQHAWWAGLTPDERLAISRAKRAALSPEDREEINRKARARHAERMATEPDYRARHKERLAAWMEAHPEKRAMASVYVARRSGVAPSGRHQYSSSAIQEMNASVAAVAGDE